MSFVEQNEREGVDSKMGLVDEVKAVAGAIGVVPTISIVANHAPHSFEFGPASARHKVYYSDQADLEAKIKGALDAEKYYASLKSEGGQV